MLSFHPSCPAATALYCLLVQNLIYLPPESIIFVVCATLRESTFASQHCLMRCVLKASIQASNEACCFSFYLKQDSFMIIPPVCMHVRCAAFILWLWLVCHSLRAELHSVQLCLIPAIPFWFELSPPYSLCYDLCTFQSYLLGFWSHVCMWGIESQSFNLLAKCMLMPVKCSIAELLKAFTPFNLSFITYCISETEWGLKQY